MKKLLTNILIFVIAISSVFSATVPKEDFDNVYDQLLVSNQTIKEIKENSNQLLLKIIDLKAENESLAASNKELINSNAELKSSFNEVYDQLVLSNTSINMLKDSNKNLTDSLKDSNNNLADSNKIILELNKNKTFIQVNSILMNGNFGYSLSFGREIIFDLTFVLGASYVDNSFGLSAGVLYYL